MHSWWICLEWGWCCACYLRLISRCVIFWRRLCRHVCRENSGVDGGLSGGSSVRRPGARTPIGASGINKENCKIFLSALIFQLEGERKIFHNFPYYNLKWCYYVGYKSHWTSLNRTSANNWYKLVEIQLDLVINIFRIIVQYECPTVNLIGGWTFLKNIKT